MIQFARNNLNSNSEHPFDPVGPVLAGAGLARGDRAAARERFHFQEQLGVRREKALCFSGCESRPATVRSSRYVEYSVMWS